METQTRQENFHGRSDWRTRAVVDTEVELATRSGRRAVADFLCSQGLPLAVPLRVLAQAMPRKAYLINESQR